MIYGNSHAAVNITSFTMTTSTAPTCSCCGRPCPNCARHAREIGPSGSNDWIYFDQMPPRPRDFEDELEDWELNESIVLEWRRRRYRAFVRARRRRLPVDRSPVQPIARAAEMRPRRLARGEPMGLRNYRRAS